jgi:hypothetical protein
MCASPTKLGPYNNATALINKAEKNQYELWSET